MSPEKPKPPKVQKPVDQLTYEQALEELEAIVNSLETDTLALEDAMSFFERGQALSAHCVSLLDQAELKIKKIASDTVVEMTGDE